MGIGPGKKRMSVTLSLSEYAALHNLAGSKGLSTDRAAWAIIRDYLVKHGGLSQGTT